MDGEEILARIFGCGYSVLPVEDEDRFKIEELTNRLERPYGETKNIRKVMRRGVKIEFFYQSHAGATKTLTIFPHYLENGSWNLQFHQDKERLYCVERRESGPEWIPEMYEALEMLKQQPV